jgi:hypothetical protein
MVTDRDIQILRVLAQYYILSRPQIQSLIFPDDKDGRVVRRRLQALTDHHLINRQTNVMYNIHAGPPPAVYFPSALGCEFLAGYYDDERYRLTPTRAPIAHHVSHWLAISDVHMHLDAAIRRQDEVKIEQWINEWDIANKDESTPEKHFRLYTVVQDAPKVICAPDAAFVLSFRGHTKTHYIEQDRGTSGAEDVAMQKHKGYFHLASEKWRKHHFPEVTVSQFSVLLITTNPVRRDQLRKKFRSKDGAALWRFAAMTDISESTVLHDPIWFTCDEDEPRALIKKDVN